MIIGASGKRHPSLFLWLGSAGTFTCALPPRPFRVRGLLFCKMATASQERFVFGWAGQHRRICKNWYSFTCVGSMLEAAQPKAVLQQACLIQPLPGRPKYVE